MIPLSLSLFLSPPYRPPKDQSCSFASETARAKNSHQDTAKAGRERDESNTRRGAGRSPPSCGSRAAGRSRVSRHLGRCWDGQWVAKGGGGESPRDRGAEARIDKKRGEAKKRADRTESARPPWLLDKLFIRAPGPAHSITRRCTTPTAAEKTRSRVLGETPGRRTCSDAPIHQRRSGDLRRA